VLVPVQVETGKEPLAPAFIVAIFEGAAGDSDAAATALSALALAFVSALLIYGIWLTGKYFYRKKRASKPQMHASREAAERPTITA
jgi:ABC-type Fe3+ transport system permease subunit